MVDRDSFRCSQIDPALAPFVASAAEPARSDALAALIVKHVRPVARRVLSGFRGPSIQPEDAEDIAALVAMRFVRRVGDSELLLRQPIASVEHYVATLTYNAVYDHLRRRYPERTRLRNRLRYVATHDARFVATTTGEGLAVSLAALGAAPLVRSLPPVDFATGKGELADALASFLRRAGGAVLLDDLLEALGPAAPPRAAQAEVRAEAANAPGAQLERRQIVETLWREVLQLREPQRAALLLNLRDADGGNAIALILLLGIATIDELAAAVGLAPEKLAEIWNELPLDDFTIAGMLGVARQQVINLRKAARERLGRRLRSTS